MIYKSGNKFWSNISFVRSPLVVELSLYWYFTILWPIVLQNVYFSTDEIAKSHRINQYRIEFFDYSKQFLIFHVYILLISLSFFYLFEAFTNESNLYILNILFLIFHYQFLYFRIIKIFEYCFKKIRRKWLSTSYEL